MEFDKFAETLKILAELQIDMMKQNNALLAENLRLWKENGELRRKNGQ